MASEDDVIKYRDEYNNKSILTNRIFMIMLGISILLLLFVFIPYFLTLEHLQNLKAERIKFQTDFEKFNSFNNSIVKYFQGYAKITEPLIDNDFSNISFRINEMILTGKTIYPKCDSILITGDFFKCNIKLMADNEYEYLINNQSQSLISSNFPSLGSNWKENYQPKILLLQDHLNTQYYEEVNNTSSISSFLQIPEELSLLTKDYFEKNLPKTIISVFLGETEPNENESIETTQIGLKNLLEAFRNNLTKVEGDIETTEDLIDSITKRVGDIGTPVGNVALGFEEVLVFSPIILAFFYLIFLYLLAEAIKLKRDNIPAGDIVDRINPLILYSYSSKKIRRLLTSSPIFIYGIYSALMLAIWTKFDPFFVFDAFFWVFVLVYFLCGFILLMKLYQTLKLL